MLSFGGREYPFMVQGLDVDHTYRASAADYATARGGDVDTAAAIALIIVMSAACSGCKFIAHIIILS